MLRYLHIHEDPWIGFPIALNEGRFGHLMWMPQNTWGRLRPKLDHTSNFANILEYIFLNGLHFSTSQKNFPIRLTLFSNKNTDRGRACPLGANRGSVSNTLRKYPGQDIIFFSKKAFECAQDSMKNVWCG